MDPPASGSETRALTGATRRILPRAQPGLGGPAAGRRVWREERDPGRGEGGVGISVHSAALAPASPRVRRTGAGRVLGS